jgi:hypothetical protein
MRINDSEMTMRWSNKARSIPEISIQMYSLGHETKEERNVKQMSFESFEEGGGRENRGKLRLGWVEVEWDVKLRHSGEDCSTKQKQWDEKTYLWFWGENY